MRPELRILLSLCRLCSALRAEDTSRTTAMDKKRYRRSIHAQARACDPKGRRPAILTIVTWGLPSPSRLLQIVECRSLALSVAVFTDLM